MLHFSDIYKKKTSYTVQGLAFLSHISATVQMIFRFFQGFRLVPGEVSAARRCCVGCTSLVKLPVGEPPLLASGLGSGQLSGRIISIVRHVQGVQQFPSSRLEWLFTRAALWLLGKLQAS